MLEVGDLFRAQVEPFVVERVVVLAEPAAGEPNRPWCGLHPEHQVLHFQWAEVLVVDGGDGFAIAHVWIVDQLFDVIDGRQRGAHSLEFRAHFAQGPVRDPLRDRVVEQVTVSAALAGRGKPWLLDQVGTPTSRITRSATEVALAEIATHRPSLVR